MQYTSHLLMIEPVNFGFNGQTAVNNSFQKETGLNLQPQALEEFNAFVAALRGHLIDVTVVKDSPVPRTPDSLFPNNWISFHDDGRIFLYPMFALNRRQERKAAVLEVIKTNFLVTEIVDITHHEANHVFLEGTGSMVLDRENKIAYACLSPRTDNNVLESFCDLAGYKPVTFRATDTAGADIYHTNVMMCIADKYAVVCVDSIWKETERNNLVSAVENTGKKLIPITLAQLNNFAGNMLQVGNTAGQQYLVMSTQAYNSLAEVQLEAIQKFNPIIHASLDTIESAGGGSARCMIAEIFLQPK
jgi:hypothetical protein